MTKRELITRELEGVSEQDLDKLLAFLQSLTEARAGGSISTLAAESALAQDWLTPEDDAAWANL
jgi:hypothetical protein